MIIAMTTVIIVAADIAATKEVRRVLWIWMGVERTWVLGRLAMAGIGHCAAGGDCPLADSAPGRREGPAVSALPRLPGKHKRGLFEVSPLRRNPQAKLPVLQPNREQRLGLLPLLQPGSSHHLR